VKDYGRKCTGCSVVVNRWTMTGTSPEIIGTSREVDESGTPEFVITEVKEALYHTYTCVCGASYTKAEFEALEVCRERSESEINEARSDASGPEEILAAAKRHGVTIAKKHLKWARWFDNASDKFSYASEPVPYYIAVELGCLGAGIQSENPIHEAKMSYVTSDPDEFSAFVENLERAHEMQQQRGRDGC